MRRVRVEFGKFTIDTRFSVNRQNLGNLLLQSAASFK